jgi:hypothetical protein
VTILGVEIPLGPVIFFCERAYIVKEELARLTKLIPNAKPDDVLKVCDSALPRMFCRGALLKLATTG